MKFEKGKIYYDKKYKDILKFSRKYNSLLIFIEQEEVKKGIFKTWGNSRIAKRIYSEKTAQRLIAYENLKEVIL